MANAHDYAKTHEQGFLHQLLDLIRIPSVSTLPECEDDIRRAAEWLADNMRHAGLTYVEIMPTAGHPVVYGEWLGASQDAPTVLVYGHYDVQPAEVSDGWDSEPFDPVIRDGKIYARGATDDKGQMFAHIKAAESFLRTDGKLPVNLKVLFEGEEESGSAHLQPFVESHKAMLTADVCVISDTGMPTIDTPAITYALRGMSLLEVTVRAATQDLHSGAFGGSVHNPLQALAEILAQLHRPDGSVSVPGFYDDVKPLTPEERAELNKTGMTERAWREQTGAPQPWGEAGYAIEERISARPTLEINGMAGGFYGEGFKTVLPAKAMAKISCRLVANQDPQRVFELVRDYLIKLTPPTVRVEVRFLGGGHAALTDIDTPMMQKAVRAYELGWGRRPYFARGGGSIPVVADFQHILKVPVILMGFGLEGDGAHGPNEHFTIEMFHRGIQTIIHFLEEVGKK
jgi:acetylornithine deacetylase/succinyl-diaminopimelate desuccinylase-like protein